MVVGARSVDFAQHSNVLWGTTRDAEYPVNARIGCVFLVRAGPILDWWFAGKPSEP